MYISITELMSRNPNISIALFFTLPSFSHCLSGAKCKFPPPVLSAT